MAAKNQDSPVMITILGPTATGKTRLAAQVAQQVNGEIISADSRQVYRGMDIGTGKDYADYVVMVLKFLSILSILLIQATNTAFLSFVKILVKLTQKSSTAKNNPSYAVAQDSISKP